MSQFTARTKQGNVCRFGLDHALGWFCDVEDPVDRDELLYSKCSLFDGLSNGKLFSFLKEELSEPEQIRLKDELQLIALDLDPATERISPCI